MSRKRRSDFDGDLEPLEEGSGKSKRRDYSALFRTLFNQINKPRPTTDDELVGRINEYIDYCTESGYSPSFQALVAYCGFSMAEVSDICSGLSPGLGAQTASIFTHAAETNRSIAYIRLGDGTHRSAASVIFESKQAIPGGGFRDDPKIILPVADYLRPANAQPLNLEALRAQYGLAPAPKERRKVIDVTPIQEE